MATRPDNLVSRWLLILLVLIAVYFFHDFLVPVLGALIIGFASWPLYSRLHEALGKRDALAASIAVLVVMVVLIVPLSMAFTYAFGEVKDWVEWLIEANREGAPMPDWLRALPLIGESVAPYWAKHVAEPHALSDLVVLLSGEQLGNIYRWLLALGSRAFHLFLILVFMLITLFFVYKDGHLIASQLDRVGESVLGERWARFSRMVPATVSSTVTGMGLVAIGEGVVLGTAYWIAGVPSPAALGVLTGFMALIPGGAPLAFTLVSSYLVATGDVFQGVGLFLWGSIELFIVDKTIRPTLVGGPIKLPFLPTFFGLIGGVTTMGIVGLFIGPVLMAMLVAIWREWLHSLTGQRSDAAG
ncbi:MAG TPA: AI-2E family transporter [Marinobacter sp.]|nr:AI-2E family transporter [Marinobacter sp.]